MDRAIANYNEAIRVDPNYALASTNRGIAYASKGDNDRAIADYNEAIRLDPKSALAFGNRGIAYGKKGDNDRALADFNEAKEEAVRALVDTAKGVLPDGTFRELAFRVRDERGHLVMQVGIKFEVHTL